MGGYSEQDGRVTFRELPSVEGAQGILFICPKCQNHSILCWFNNPRNAQPVPPEATPRPGRWTFTGDTVDEVSLLPSVDLSVVDAEHPGPPTRCMWHGWVKNGEAA